MQSDLEIARSAHLSPLFELVSKWGVSTESLIPYGHYMAKVDHRLGFAPPAADSKLVLVTAITPTPAGEGKTVHTIGLSLALNRLGKRAAATIRQPSMGPVFGIKGGAAGGGYSQVLPMEDINLHLTGDFHAVTAAHNLMAAALDTSVLLDNPHEIDPERILIKRVVDVNDRCLREIQVGLGGKLNGVPRTSGFEITSASEVMAVLGLARDLPDMRARLGRIIVAETFGGQPVTAEQIGVAGAMAALLSKALDPTLLQTTEGTPALVHTGPFANIAHGNSSVVGRMHVCALGCQSGHWQVARRSRLTVRRALVASPTPRLQLCCVRLAPRACPPTQRHHARTVYIGSSCAGCCRMPRAAHSGAHTAHS